ncbi:MAG: hypothetical protein SCH71_13740 [Desulfobulbaceae bacterium]|nr:hypothetical protein [Desulfobulbaceae bacterium]
MIAYILLILCAGSSSAESGGDHGQMIIGPSGINQYPFFNQTNKEIIFMKIKILSCLIAMTGALLLSATNGFSFGTFGDNVNTECTPEVVYTGDCTLCHVSGDFPAATPEKTAYLAGGTTLTDTFCPTVTPPPAITWSACTPQQVGPFGDIVRIRLINCNIDPSNNRNGWLTLSPTGQAAMLETVLAAMNANAAIAIATDGTTDTQGYNFAIGVIYSK